MSLSVRTPREAHSRKSRCSYEPRVPARARSQHDAESATMRGCRRTVVKKVCNASVSIWPFSSVPNVNQFHLDGTGRSLLSLPESTLRYYHTLGSVQRHMCWDARYSITLP